MSDNQHIHQCIQQETLKEVWEEIHEMKTRQAVQESDMKTVKGDITEMKKDIKELSDDLNKGNTRILISIITSGIAMLIGLALNYFAK